MIELYFPAPHTMQPKVFAAVSPYVPAPQITQSASASWLVAVVAASVRYVPEGQETQVLDAVAALYVPAPHITQSASASCLVAVVAESERYVPAGQSTHDDEPVEAA